MTPETPKINAAVDQFGAELGLENGIVKFHDKEGKEQIVDLTKPLDTLNEENINNLLQAIVEDPGIKGYTRLMLENVVLRERQRLRQRIEKPQASEQEQLTEANWQTYYE